MVLWLVFAAMTAAAVLAIMVPLSRGPAAARREPAGVTVYRDQLRAVDADVTRGLIGEDEADAARTEISRRLLTASNSASAADNDADAAARGRWAVLLGGIVVAVSLGGYLLGGSPGLPGQPLAERRAGALADQDVETLVSRVESHLQDNPGDARGWEVIAPVYLRIGRTADAARAYENTIRIAGSTAERHAGLGEALTREADGVVTAGARAAFEKAIELDPLLVRPRFYLALADAQDGDTGGAVAAWKAMLEDAPPDAPWRRIVEQQIAMAEGGSNSTSRAPISEQTQAVMIEQMVSGLAERLSRDGDDLEGWLRLMRSYTVLGRDTDASTALADARRIFADDAAALQRIDQAAAELGIKGTAR